MIFIVCGLWAQHVIYTFLTLASQRPQPDRASSASAAKLNSIRGAMPQDTHSIFAALICTEVAGRSPTHPSMQRKCMQRKCGPSIALKTEELARITDPDVILGLSTAAEAKEAGA